MLLTADLEYSDGGNESYVITGRIGHENNFASWSKQFFAYRHSNGLNVLHVDLHVKWLAYSEALAMESTTDFWNGGMGTDI